MGEGDENSGDDLEYDGDIDSEDENAEEYFESINDAEDRRLSNPFEEGTIVFSNPTLDILVKSVSHKKRNRYDINDHLYKITFHRKTGEKIKLLDLESAIEIALIKIINQLQKIYKKDNLAIF